MRYLESNKNKQFQSAFIFSKSGIVEILKINGIYNSLGKIELENSKIIDWNNISNNKLPIIPSGSKIKLNISIDTSSFLNGTDGIVWATYDLRQAEIIQSALVAQQINSEIKNIHLNENVLYALKISNSSDIDNAIDFIWRHKSGLRLKPDWSYPNNEINNSFEQWLSGQ